MYSLSEVSAKTGVNYHKLGDWIKRGFITPSIQAAQGSGLKNLFSDHDLIAVKSFEKLVAAGMSRAVSSIICKALVKKLKCKEYIAVFSHQIGDQILSINVEKIKYELK